MTEENKEVIVENNSEVVENEEVQTEVVETKEPTESTAEDKARDAGWRPLEEYEGDPDKWVDAKEFLRRGELFDKIDHLSRDLKDTKKALRALQEHHEKVKETEFKHALEQLREEKKKALEEGDADRLIEIDEQIQDAKLQQKAEVQQAKEVQLDPRFVAWVEQNKWYAHDPEMRAVADQIGPTYAQRTGKSPEEVLHYVTAKIRTMYPEKFTNPNRNKPSAVESVGRPTSKKVDSFELTEDEKRVMNTFVRQGIMTKEAYVEELKKVRGAE